MDHNLDTTIALLARMPAGLNALLRDLPETWVLRNEGENTWSVFDIVGHLAHADRTNWMPRARVILRHGQTQAFTSFDRLGQIQASQGKTLGQLLDEFSSVRAGSLDELRSLKLQPEDMQKRGQHPALGAVTLSELLATWAAHDLTHLHQISRVMAYQYRETVGPFRSFLGVLRCEGHGA